VSVKTIFSDAEGRVYLLCPFCGKSDKRSVGQFPNIHKPLSISCSCGNSYDVQIEIRKAYRKETSLEAFYSKWNFPGDFEKATIVDLTLGGCRLRASKEHTLNQGDWITLVFRLDNPERTEIRKDAVICRVNGNDIGCSFAVRTVYDPDLGFYLRTK